MKITRRPAFYLYETAPPHGAARMPAHNGGAQRGGFALQDLTRISTGSAGCEVAQVRSHGAVVVDATREAPFFAARCRWVWCSCAAPRRAR